ncbi:MAG: deoxyribonuclease IV, partial [Candidatus Binatia bacterium]
MKKKDKHRGPLLGAHMSIAGGVGNALLEGKKVECDAIQIFTKSSRQWASKPYTREEIQQFEINRKETGITRIIAHDSYLLNLGSPDPVLRTRSVAAFVDELERCEILGVSNLVAHPGSHTGAGEAQGIKTIASSLDEVHKACPGYNVKITLEITAGQGSNLGYRFQQISDIMDATK